MDTAGCEYCTSCAIGVDEDDEMTCGECAPAVGPLPPIIEVSDDDSEEADPALDTGTCNPENRSPEPKPGADFLGALFGSPD